MPALIVIAVALAFVIWTTWPFLLLMAALTALGYTIKRISEKKDKNHRESQNEKVRMVSRAHAQHNAIMSGDLELGTYGKHMPPEELRTLPKNLY